MWYLPIAGTGLSRVCGGAVLRGITLPLREGLSPRVRGSLQLEPGPIGARGSIPACAGEPRLDLLRVGELRVYPRVCGGAGPNSR